MVESFLCSIKQNAHLQGLTMHLHLDTHEVKAYHRLFLHGQALLPKLETLRLWKMPVLNPRLISQRRPFPSLIKLNLSNCRFSSVLDLRRLVDNFFPELSYLNLSSLKLTSSHVTLPNQWPRQTVSLSHLTSSDGSRLGPVVRWLSSTLTLTSIRLLWIPRYNLKMLQLFGQNIQTLRIDWVSSDLDEDETISLGSHVLPILNELRLDFHNNGDRLRQFCAILSRCLPSPTLSSIRIRTGVWSIEDYFHLDDTLILLPPRTRVEIDVEEWEYLPKLNEKGMLVVPNDDNYPFWY
ncbi:hypothetical protein C8Q75DRAFT_567204 [Abortiporus biennis]|nr:hypothetical protein C8Q75DRAFT_567204 [Abortiporus biennis]